MLKSLFTRRWPIYIKFMFIMVSVVFYFAYLFRASLQAIEQKNREKLARKPENARALMLQTHHHRHARDEMMMKTIPPKTTPIPTTLNPVYEYSEELHDATSRDLHRRTKQLNKVCKERKLFSKYEPKPWEFFISPGHNLVWCNVFKAASTMWMYYFNVLGGYEPTYLQRTHRNPIELARVVFPRPKLDELIETLQTSVSFLIAREPFERLISGYRNKLEGFRNQYYKPIANYIVEKYRSEEDKIRLPNKGPTFKEFIQFLIRSHKNNDTFNEHWAPVYQFCTPCTVNFTLIAKVETLDRDSNFIIRQAGLEQLLLGKKTGGGRKHFNKSHNQYKTELLIEKYFSDLDKPTLNDLLEIYKIDFELFGYNYTKYYDIVQPQEVPQQQDDMHSSQRQPNSNHHHNKVSTDAYPKRI